MPWSILAPVRHPDEVEGLVQAGADEFYAGLLSPRTLERTGGVFSFNFRPHCNGNLRGVDDLRAVLDRADGRPVLLTYNLRYPPQACDWVLDELSEAAELGVAGVIVADLGLAAQVRARHPDLELHASSVAGVFNSEAAAQWREAGATRVIVPRACSREEVTALARAVEGIDLELFIMTEKCVFANAHCGLEHGVYQSTKPMTLRLAGLAGRLVKRSPNQDMLAERVAARNPALRQVFYRMIRGLGSACTLPFEGPDGPFAFGTAWETKEACGICSLWWIRELGAVTSLKVVGRTQPMLRKLGDVRAVRGAVEALEVARDEEDFRRRCGQIFKRHRGGACTPELCYYGEA